MKILQVAPHYYPSRGGVERHVQAVSERLAALGHDVAVATLSTPGQEPRIMMRNGVPVRTFRSLGVAPAYRFPPGLFGWLLRSSFDVVHVHNYHGGLTPIVAAARRHGCMVVSPHLNDRAHSRTAQLLHRAYGPIGRWSLRRATAVVCVSAAERERLIQRFGLHPDDLVLIPNGADALAPADGQAGQVHRDAHVILVVGRLEAYKQIDRAIEALAYLPDFFRLVIVGDGPLRTALAHHASGCGVADRVTFAGRVSDDQLAGWYARAAALISLSSAEAFGLTVIEALAGGAHVICNDIPAFREIALRFPHKVRVLPGGDVAAVVAAIKEVTDCSGCPPLELGDYSWSAVTRRLVELYGRLLSRDGPG